MKLSIIVPAYNEEAYIGKCLASIAAEQARGRFEVETIVVNNASTDRTADVARTFPFARVIDEPKKGLVRARQTGYQASSGELVANVDADTLMPEGWIAQVFKEFSVHPELVALSGPYIYYDLSSVTNWFVSFWYRMGQGVSFLDSLVMGRTGTMLQGGNFILRRSALEKAGGFDLNFDFYGEDTAIAKEMGRQGKVKFTFCLPMYTSGRRLRGEGIFTMAGKYGINFFWTIIFGRAYSKEYKDIRL
ncbi:MAG: glycosyltransferase family 2 protein [Candidatus Moranbacteria bacterium]|nr:glycosyltransferase family 2 protein [Candidatus Moranbacteria bacterium]